MEQKIKKWQKKIHDLVFNEVINLNIRRYIFNKQREIVKNNPKLQKRNIFIDYLFSNYAEAQVLAVSRLVEDKPVDSFVALLNDMLSSYEEVIQSGGLKNTLVNKMKNEATDDFIKNHFQKETEDRTEKFSWEKINSDKFDILKETAKIKLFRDKWIAHRDNKRKSVIIQYDEIEKVIKFIEEKIHEYYTFLTDASVAKNELTDSILPVGIEDDEEVFNFAWIDKKKVLLEP